MKHQNLIFAAVLLVASACGDNTPDVLVPNASPGTSPDIQTSSSNSTETTPAETTPNETTPTETTPNQTQFCLDDSECGDGLVCAAFGECIEDPGDEELPTCYEQLTAAGVEYRAVTEDPPGDCGVTDAVNIRGPINGINYGYGPQLQTGWTTSCLIAMRLVSASEVFKAHGVESVEHIGSYNCRTVAGSETLSQHSFGTAFDIKGYRTSDQNIRYIDHWEHDTDEPESDEGQFLYDVTHALHNARVFNRMLTPDYDADHDDHVHVDLTGEHRMDE